MMKRRKMKRFALAALLVLSAALFLAAPAWAAEGEAETPAVTPISVEAFPQFQ